MKKLTLIMLALALSSILTAQVMFVEEYFDSGLPSDWQIQNMFISIGMGVDNTNALTASNHFGDLTAQAITPTFGPIQPGTVLEFDYCVVEFWWGGQINMAQTVVNFYVGETLLYTVDNQTHVPSRDFRRMSLNLDAFVGQTTEIKIDVSIGPRIDEIAIDFDNFMVYHVVDHDLKAVSLSGTSTPTEGVQAEYKFVVYNGGLFTATNYSVDLVVNEEIVLSTNGVYLPVDSYHDFFLRWTPQNTGNFEIYAKIEYAQDLNPLNDVSNTLNVEVQPHGTFISYIGDINSPLFYNNPLFNYNWGSSVSQTIYPVEEINVSGTVTHLTYKFRSTLSSLPYSIPISIYLASIDKNEFDDRFDWVPLEQFTLVYQGSLSLNSSGTHDVTFELDTPFVHNGSNLVVMGQRHLTNWFEGHRWHTTDTGNQNRSLTIQSDDIEYNLQNYPQNSQIHTFFPNITIHFNTFNMGHLNGVIANSETGEPIHDAKIQIVETSQSVHSEFGEFSLSYILPGTISINVTKYKFYDLTIENIEIIENQQQFVDIEIVPRHHDMAALTVTGPSLVEVEKEYIFTVTVRNDGHQSATGYSINLMQYNENGEDILLASENGTSLVSEEVKEYEITWIPENAGFANVYGMVVYDLDDNPLNDKSHTIRTEVVVLGTVTVYIGNPDSTVDSPFWPFNYWHESSLNQMIYLESEIGMYGSLTRIGYTFNGIGDIDPGINVRLYAAVTELNAFSSTDTWIPTSEFTLIFEGELPVTEQGKRDIIVDLDTPFTYGGGNLVLMAYKPYIPNWYVATNAWQQTMMPATRTIWDFNEFGDVDFDNPELALFRSEIPNVTLYFQTEGMASLSGIVTHNGSPLADVFIEIDGTLRRTYTDENGYYIFEFIEDEFVTITATKHGYITETFENIQIPEATPVVFDFQMYERPIITVYGNIISSDNGQPLQNVQIELLGYQDYLDIRTNNLGDFIIRDVFANFTYELNVTMTGYQKHIDIIEIHNSDFHIPQITLAERAYIPYNFTAVKSGENVNLTWSEPTPGQESWFTHAHTLEIDNAMGGYMGNPAILIPVMRFSQAQLQSFGVSGAELTAVDFVPFTTNATYTIHIYQGGSGTPLDPGTLIHEQLIPASDIIPELWTQVILNKPINIPTWGELWIGYKADILGGFACTAAPGPGVAGYGDVVWNNGSWEIMANHGIDWNWLIRGFANGVYISPENLVYNPALEPKTFTNSTVTRNNPEPALANVVQLEQLAFPIGEYNATTSNSPSMRRGNTENGLLTQSKISNLHKPNRALLGYDIWRTNVNNILNESEWVQIITNHPSTSFTDTTWSSVDDGDYRYVIRANYTQNNISLPVFSNRVNMNLTAVVTINIKTHDESPINGAFIRLVNNNGDPEYVYEEWAFSNEITITDVWLGKYTLIATYPTYAQHRNIDLEINTFDFQYDITLYKMNVLLTEGFEAGEFPPTGWITIDADGDGHNWELASEPGYSANNGAYSAMSASYHNTYGGLTPDNYLVLPQINLPENHHITLNYYVATQDKFFPNETYSILISTTTPDVQSFNEIFMETLSAENEFWQERYIDLTGYAGADAYIAFRHHSSADEFVIKIDDVLLYSTDQNVSDRDISILPTKTTLGINYPNPFNPTTTIAYTVAKEGNVKIDVYNIRGQKVKTIVDDNHIVGYFKVEWNGKDENERDVASGVYFYRMQAEAFSETKRMLLLK